VKLRRKILTGAAALVVAVPVGIVTAFLGPTLFASAGGVQDPVMCNLAGTINFSPPLTPAGQTSSSPNSESVTLTGLSLSHCLSSDAAGAPSSGSINNQSLSVPATKEKVGKTTEYNYGNCSGLDNPKVLKLFKNLSLTTSWTGGAGGSTTVITKPPTATSNNAGEVGFAIPTKFSAGNYPVKVDQTIAYFTSGSSTAIEDCVAGSGQSPSVSSLTFDSTTSTALQ
jgi:hypothetical protein